MGAGGKGGGVNPSSQPDHFFTVFFLPFSLREAVKYYFADFVLNLIDIF